MDPALTVLLVVLAVLVGAGGYAFGKLVARGANDEEHLLLAERGLEASEIRTLIALVGALPDTRLADVLISPLRFNRAVSAFVELLRESASAAPEDQQRLMSRLADIDAVRRRVHPRGGALRRVTSTRDLPEGTELRLELPRAGTGTWVNGVLVRVNEDHLDILLERAELLDGTRVGVATRVEVYRDGQGRCVFTTALRTADRTPAPRVVLEHTESVATTNRREFLREATSAPLIVSVTPEGADPQSAVRGSVRDLSGGGLAFTAPVRVETGDRVAVTLFLTDELDELPPIRTHAEVRRTSPGPSEDVPIIHARWDEALDDEPRELIIRHVRRAEQRRILATRILEQLDRLPVRPTLRADAHPGDLR